MTQLMESLQAALADRYAVVRQLGRGGGGTVFLAVDLRHERHVALKVLRPEISASVGSERFLREIRFAAKLQHPHILPLHDSGEANGLLYYVMPYIEGQSLRERLARETQLPLDDALHIAKEVADALTYAHARGIIHRDIKPENILLTSDAHTGAWHALVADFGIARAFDEAAPALQTQTGMIVGTPVYMSPEQASGAREIDGRSDVYSLGCVVYEMLTGAPPFDESSLQALIAAHLVSVARPVSAIRSSVPTHVEAAIEKALAKQKADRFATAAQFAEALAGEVPLTRSTPGRLLVRSLEVPLRSWRRWSTWQRWAVAALVVLAGLRAMALFPSTGNATPKSGAILIAEVQNTTGDPVFDRSLTAALTTSLQQSAFVSVFPRARVAQTLQMMQRPQSDTLLDERLAREVAQREGLRVVIASSISQVGGTYALTARLVDPDSGNDLGIVSERAKTKGEVLDALDRLARSVRKELGESSWSVRGSMPLPRATTSSLEALKKYADGSRAWDSGKRDEARELWLAALALDSNFALVHADLGGYYYWNNNRPEGELHFKKALAHLERLSDREQLWIRAGAAGWRGDRTEAINLLKVLTIQYPQDRTAWYNLGYDYMRAGRFQEALDAYHRLLTIDSLHATAYINIAVSHGGLLQWREAVSAYRKAFTLRPEMATQDNTNHEFGQALIQAGLGEEARANFQKMLGGDAQKQSRGHRSLALLDMLEGKYAEAERELKEAVLLTQAMKAPTSELRNRLHLAVIYEEQGNEAARREQLREVYRLFRTSYIEPGFLNYAGRIYMRAGEPARAAELLDSMKARANPANTTDQADIKQLSAELLLNRGQADSAVTLFGLAAKEQKSTYRTWALADAMWKAGDRKGALELYRDIEHERDTGWEAQEALALAPYRIGRLQEELGDVASAAKSYEAFLESWKGADENLRAVRDAKARLEKLRRSQRLPLLPRNPSG